MAKKKRRTELDVDDSLVAEPAPPPPPPPAEETEEEPEAPPPEPPPPPKRKVNKIKLLIVLSSGLGVILLVSAVVWGIMVYIKSRPEEPEPAPEPVVKEEKEPVASLAPAPAVDIPPVYQFRDFYVNMESGKDVVIVRIALAAQMSDAKVKDEIVRNLVLIRENIYSFLRSRKISGFSDEKKKKEMAVEIAIILNRSIQSGAVTRVYITGLSLE